MNVGIWITCRIFIREFNVHLHILNTLLPSTCSYAAGTDCHVPRLRVDLRKEVYLHVQACCSPVPIASALAVTIYIKKIDDDLKLKKNTRRFRSHETIQTTLKTIQIKIIQHKLAGFLQGLSPVGTYIHAFANECMYACRHMQAWKHTFMHSFTDAII